MHALKLCPYACPVCLDPNQMCCIFLKSETWSFPTPRLINVWWFCMFHAVITAHKLQKYIYLACATRLTKYCAVIPLSYAHIFKWYKPWECMPHRCTSTTFRWGLHSWQVVHIMVLRDRFSRQQRQTLRRHSWWFRKPPCRLPYLRVSHQLPWP